MEPKAFVDKLGPEWTELFSDFIKSPKMDDIYKRLRKDKDNNKIFPLSENTYKAFQMVKPEDVTLIMMSMEPYSGENYKDKSPQANGLCLDCTNNPEGKLQPSLVSFWEGLAKFYNLPYDEYYKTKSLGHLAQQGVLLVNRSLTVCKGKIESHIGLWDDFWKFFFEDIMRKYPHVPVLLLGEHAKYAKRWIFPMTHPTFELSHPSAAARNSTDWETDGKFELINNYIRNEKGAEKAITWSYKIHSEQKQGILSELITDTFLPF